MVQEGLHYTEQHEWVKVDGDIATIGITDHAQELLGEITYVELPETDNDVEAGGELAVIESSKAASDVFSPVKGQVVEINAELESTPELINQECYKSGWICKIKLTNADAVSSLMDDKKYAEYLNEAE
jgi:glycine cleavage system H protein